MSKQWSEHQNKIFNFVKWGAGNGIVEAVAGSGKTTTMVEAKNHCDGSHIFLAFNAAIARELKERGVNARTFHSITYNPALQFKGASTVTEDKLKQLVNKNFQYDDSVLYGTFAQKLVGLARQAGFNILTPGTDEEWMQLCIHYDIEPDNERADMGRGLELAKELLRLSNASNMVDFDDMLYFSVLQGITLPKFAYIFVDEAQDTNAIQRAILRKMMTKNSRLIAVGDPAQAIYGFRGADSNSMEVLATEFQCTRLPLSISYRCPTSVVTYARQWVSHIEAAPDAPEGEVSEPSKWSVKDFQPNDLVVCRTTAPLINTAFRCMRERVPVMVMGREIGAGLKALIKRMNTENFDILETKLEAYKEREVEKAIVKKDEGKQMQIEDKVSAVLFLMNSMGEDERTIPDLMRVLDHLFSDKKNAVVLATIHKSKGLEADRVWWLNRSMCPSKWARQPWQQQQELNLCYVATTRAKKTLMLIEER